MYLVVIAWMYVVLMMSVAEATNSTGTILGAIVTFLLYGVAPVALVIYLMRTPARRKTIKQREAQALAQHQAQADAPPAASATAVPSDNTQKR
jgi:mannose/fructose/N-acetylgalactosamine-specific phosphotransferase system component IID